MLKSLLEILKLFRRLYLLGFWNIFVFILILEYDALN